jgi:hypothetical protein
MCYAVSQGPDPLGPWYRYAFLRPLFPDYPRPAIWPDGYYVPTSTGDGGVRWYKITVDSTRALHVRQQGTYAPGRLYRWMGSPAMDALGNIGIGYSFGGTPHFAGQRFAGPARRGCPGPAHAP